MRARRTPPRERPSRALPAARSGVRWRARGRTPRPGARSATARGRRPPEAPRARRGLGVRARSARRRAGSRPYARTAAGLEPARPATDPGSRSPARAATAPASARSRTSRQAPGEASGRGERVVLPTGPIERGHELGSEALVGGMLTHELLQRGDEPAVLAEPELRLDAVLDAGEPQLLEPRDRRRRERLIGQVGEGWPPPERQRLAQARRRALGRAVREGRAGLLREPLEPGQVERLLPGADEVARRTRLDGGAEELAQIRDLALDLRDGGRRRLAAVEVVGQAVDRDDPVGAQEEDRQYRTLTRSAKADGRPGRADDLERAQYAELERHGWRTDSEPIAARPSMAHRQRGPQEVVMSAHSHRSPQAALSALIALVMVAL